VAEDKIHILTRNVTPARSTLLTVLYVDHIITWIPRTYIWDLNLSIGIN